MTRLTPKLRESLWQADNRTCHYCREPLELVDTTFDHIVPLAFDGPTVRWNLVIACEPCNTALAASVGKCKCTKCKRALNRYHLAKARRDGKSMITLPVSNGPMPRTSSELLRTMTSRRDAIRKRLNASEDHDSFESAAMRGKLRAYTEICDLIVGVDAHLWQDALVEALGEEGMARARELYRQASYTDRVNSR